MQSYVEAVRRGLEHAFDDVPGTEQFLSLLRDVATRAISDRHLALMLPVLCCQATGGQAEHGVYVAAVGMLAATAARVLDDVQDQDSDDALWRSIGAAQAITVATALTFAANAALNRLTNHGVPAALVTTIQADLAWTGLEMCSGQYLDLGSEEASEIGWETYEHIVTAKSAASTAWSCRAGAVLGRPGSPVQAYATFGHHFGLLHQTVNDLRGLYGTDGKQDVPRRKKTLPLVYALSVASPDVKARLSAAWKRASDNPDAVSEVRNLVIQLGAIPYILAVADGHYAHALAALRDTDGNPQAIAELAGLLRECRVTGNLQPIGGD